MHTGFDHKDEWNNWIGKKIKKFSGKPFKCGFEVVTVKGFEINPNSSKDAFRIEEDDTLVDCFRCFVLENPVEVIGFGTQSEGDVIVGYWEEDKRVFHRKSFPIMEDFIKFKEKHHDLPFLNVCVSRQKVDGQYHAFTMCSKEKKTLVYYIKNMSKIQKLREILVKSFAEINDNSATTIQYRFVKWEGQIIKPTFMSAPPCIPVEIKLNSIDPSYREVSFKITFDDKERDIIIYTSAHFGPQKLCNLLSDKIEDVVLETLREDYDRIIKEYSIFGKRKK